jgi:hypothetical protein
MNTLSPASKVTTRLLLTGITILLVTTFLASPDTAFLAPPNTTQPNTTQPIAYVEAEGATGSVQSNARVSILNIIESYDYPTIVGTQQISIDNISATEFNYYPAGNNPPSDYVLEDYYYTATGGTCRERANYAVECSGTNITAFSTSYRFSYSPEINGSIMNYKAGFGYNRAFDGRIELRYPDSMTFVETDPAPVEQTQNSLIWFASNTESLRPVVKFHVDVDECGSQELAEQFAPVMYFHRDEVYRPIEIDVPLEHAFIVKDWILPNDRRTIQKSPITPADLAQDNRWDADHIIDFGHTGWPFVRFTSLKGEYIRDIRPEVTPNAYVRMYCPSTPQEIEAGVATATVIQYWFFYYLNLWEPWNFHQGDWEMVQVMLDSEGNATHAGYSQHYGGTRLHWNNIETQDGHPVVYVAEGSHASFFRPRTYYWSTREPYPDVEKPWHHVYASDKTSPYRYSLEPDNDIIPISVLSEETDSWLAFPGRWGDKYGNAIGDMAIIKDYGPPSPVYRVAKHLDGDPSLWNDPIAWFNALEWDESAEHSKIGNLHVSTPEHVQPRVTHLQPRNNIANIPAEYFHNPATGRRTVIVAEPDPETAYVVTIDGISVQAAQMQQTDQASLITLNFPDIQGSTIISAEYQLPADWNVNSEARSILHHNSSLVMQVDIDGDGSFERDVISTVLEREDFDFIPPSPVTDLQISETVTNSVKLVWTAPGDDDTTGTAKNYDIRYSFEPITNDTWGIALPISTTVEPAVSGTAEQITVDNLPVRTIYIAMKSTDDMYRHSSLSNVVMAELGEPIYLPIILR